MPVHRIIILALTLLAPACSVTQKDGSDNLAKPYGAEPLTQKEISALRSKFPSNWTNPPRAHSPAGPDSRILYSMIGKLRLIEQKVTNTGNQDTHSARVGTAFMDPSGKFLLGRDYPKDGNPKDATLFAIFHDTESGLYRGVSWTKNLRGKEIPMQMTGKDLPGDNVIRWKPYSSKPHVGLHSRLKVANPNEFTWTIRLFKGGEMKGELTNTSRLTQPWPEQK